MCKTRKRQLAKAAFFFGLAFASARGAFAPSSCTYCVRNLQEKNKSYTSADICVCFDMSLSVADKAVVVCSRNLVRKTCNDDGTVTKWDNIMQCKQKCKMKRINTQIACSVH